MIKKVIGTVISVSLSCSLLLGSESLQQFAFYVMCGMTGIAWLCLFCGAVKDEAAAEIRSRLWISAPSSAFSLYAMISTGHTILAAASFMGTFFILTLAFRKPEVTA
ncbi:hypothetical protein [Pseudomonas extremaustralis]|uniref:hypothetical protein n=1 Tax=Pseudomonas extremaustralis TaxID=359110 RepID=UPI00285F938D|nr:hypothetical protein [Pseudomonas extremaustralis]MDR6579995.1 hypothetical protein [Pseudomonas extremaustralis]